MLRVLRSPTFRLEGEVAELADIRPDVGMRSDVFLQHAGFLAADAALLADVFPSTATTNVNVVLIGFVTGRKNRLKRLCGDFFLFSFFKIEIYFYSTFIWKHVHFLRLLIKKDSKRSLLSFEMLYSKYLERKCL